MNLAAALIYWVIVTLWLAVLGTVAVAYIRNPRTFGATRLLLAVVAIDTVRNIVENLYFGLYFGAQYGLFPGAIVGVLGNPNLLIIPKVINVAAACAVLGLLLLRWLPSASLERANADDDIRRKTDALTQETEERRRLFETSLDLILITDRQGHLVRVSPSSTPTLGYSPEEMTGRSAADFVHRDDLEAVRREMRLARAGQHTRNFETRYVHKGGRIVTLAWSGVWSDPEQRHFFVGRDMTERKAAEEQLRQLAHYDQLTGLANQVTLRNDLAELLNLTRSDGRATSIAKFDLDGFKDINGTLGRSTGDRLLQEVARRLTEMAQDASRVYRLGGDEFGVTIPDCGDPHSVGQVVDAMLKRLGERFDIDGHRLFIGASAGIAVAGTDGANVEDLISNADLALYDAKAAGGRTYRVFLSMLRAKAHARRELDTELRRAFADKRIYPLLPASAASQRRSSGGCGSLAALAAPERGILSPASFIEARRKSRGSRCGKMDFADGMREGCRLAHPRPFNSDRYQPVPGSVP